MSETTATTTPQRRPRQPDCRLTDQQFADLITRERPYKVFDGISLIQRKCSPRQGHEKLFERVVSQDTHC